VDMITYLKNAIFLSDRIVYTIIFGERNEIVIDDRFF